MENHQSSQIRTLSYVENEDHPVFGTLVEQILHLLKSRLIFSDIIIHQNSPLTLRQPKGLVAVSDSPITREELTQDCPRRRAPQSSGVLRWRFTSRTVTGAAVLPQLARR